MSTTPTETERRRFLLVSNPIAGPAGRSLTEEVVHALAARGADVTRLDDADAVSQHDWSRAAGRFDAAVAAGGDGTIRALGARLAGSALPVGIIPRGTGNVFASEIGLPHGAEAIADILMRGSQIRIRGARANGAPFYLMAGVGFDGEIVHRLDLPAKRLIGRAAYTRPTLAALAGSQPRLVCRIDGAPHEAAHDVGWVLVANAGRYGGSFRLTERAGLDKDGLAVILFRRGGRLRRMMDLLALGLGRLEYAPGVTILPAMRVAVTAEGCAAVQLDGDDFGQTPVEIVWGEPELNLIVPEAYAAAFAARRAGA
jgi:diacylglycerol kinase family enzyme